jgi:hypothetical protein
MLYCHLVCVVKQYCHLVCVVKQYCHLVCGVKQFVIWFVFCKLYTKVAVLMYEFSNNINMPYTIFLLYKSNKTICKVVLNVIEERKNIPKK